MRPIDADFVQDALTKTITELLSKSQNESTQYVAMGLASIKTIIDIAPTLDVAPVRHGKWVRDHKFRRFIHCSLCGVGKDCFNSTEIWIQKTKDYCPHCGAKMDAGQEDDSHGENTDE